jgi:ferritin heavy chain
MEIQSCASALCSRSIEYNVSYVYHALYAYFDRDNVGLPGFAAFFKAASEEEREHAEMLMKYQNLRGGRVRLAGISIPEMEFNHPEKVRQGRGLRGRDVGGRG